VYYIFFFRNAGMSYRIYEVKRGVWVILANNKNGPEYSTGDSAIPAAARFRQLSVKAAAIAAARFL
jgi:hypothetical protein